MGVFWPLRELDAEGVEADAFEILEIRAIDCLNFCC